MLVMEGVLVVVHDLKYMRKFLLVNPTYWVLNACRMKSFFKERRVLSKLEGGQWGIEDLLEKYRRLIRQVMPCYQMRVNKNQIPWNKEKLKEFAKHILNKIENTNMHARNKESKL